MGESDSIVHLRDLVKRYDTLTAVDGISLEIRRGEIFGLLGPNGAGKTTTISMIAGLLPATSGEIEVAGHDAHRANVAIKRALGVVPQELAIYPRLTGRENLEFFGQLYGLSGSVLVERSNRMLELVGLSDRAASRAETYSGGMKRRLNLAAGLMHSPQLLLLDEPTVGVDPQSRNHIFEGIQKLNRDGLTILYTSHYMEEVEALCDRVGIMDRGKLIACDTVANLIAGLGGTLIEIGLTATLPTAEQLARLTTLDNVEGIEFLPATGADAGEGEALVGTLRIRSQRPNQAVPGLVGALAAEKLSLVTLSVHQPGLEDVFLALTGKSLRD